MIKNYFLTTIRTLLQNPLYTALSVFGIALTFVFVSFIFLMASNSRGGYIPPKYTKRTWHAEWIDIGNGQTRGISKEQYETWVPKMKTPEMIVVTNGEMNETIVLPDQTFMVTVRGVSDNYYDMYRFKFIRGRAINKQEIADNVPVTVIDKSTANIYFGQNEDPIGKNFELNGIQYKVVGVVEDISLFIYGNHIRSNMWIPLGTLKTLTNGIIHYMISFTARDEASIADMQAEFTRVLDETNMAEGSQYSVPVWAKESIEQHSSLSKTSTIVMLLFVMMLIPAINILSLNISRSHDRSEEIAIRKAFGAPKHTIFGQLFIENTVITLVGAVIGMCLVPLLMNAIDKMMLSISVIPLSLSLHFNWTTILWVAVPCVLIFSFLSGSIPAYITAKREIVNVLKGEEQ